MNFTPKLKSLDFKKKKKGNLENFQLALGLLKEICSLSSYKADIKLIWAYLVC